MGLFKKIFDLVKEELSDEPKKQAQKKGTPKATTSKPQGDSFEQLCAKAKAGNLGAQFRLAHDSDKYSAEKLNTVNELFKEMMDNGDIEGKCIWGFLNRETPEGKKAMDQAADAGAFFGIVLNAFFLAAPRGKRRDWNPEIKDDRLIKVPVDYLQAIILLEKAINKLETCPKDVQITYRRIYGLLAYNLIFYENSLDRAMRQEANDEKLRKYAVIGAEYNDPIACYELGDCYLHGRHGFKENIDFALTYLKKAEKNIEFLYGDSVFLSLLYYDLANVYAQKGDTKVVAYIEKAADLGSSSAMANLSEFYERGEWDLPKDIEKAVMWRNKAMMLGFDFNEFNCPSISI